MNWRLQTTHRIETSKIFKLWMKNIFYHFTMQMSSAFPPMSYKFHISQNIFSYSPQLWQLKARCILIFKNLKKTLHDQVRNFLQAKNKLVTVRIWSPNSIWLSCGGCVYIGSQIEILGYNCQYMICTEGLDNKLTHFMIDLIISSVSI